MDPSRPLNILLFVALLVRGWWWCRATLEDRAARLAASENSAAPERAAIREQEAPIALENAADESVAPLLSRALERGNSSVLAALLGDAAAHSVQHRYLPGGFAAPALSLSSDGNALLDLAAATRIVPNLSASDGAAAELLSAPAEAWETGAGTNYGGTLLMSLDVMLPSDGSSGAFDFEFFQHAWHQWQLSGQLHEHRGQAAEIALKNLERGLSGRHAATLVGDIGAVPRVPGLLAAFVASACRELVDFHHAGCHGGCNDEDDRALLQAFEDRLSQASREISMATHDRPEALIAAEFLARVSFRLIFRELLLPPTPLWVRHPVDRPTAPSLVWRAADAVRREMAVPFLQQAVRDAEQLCKRQLRRAPLGGELGGARRLDPSGDLEDLGSHHTRRLPTPQSAERQRELFGLSGGAIAVLPAALYLSWKYERYPAAALTANTLLGGNAAGRGVVLGLLLGARAGSAAVPPGWLAQLRSAGEAHQALGALSLQRVVGPKASVLRYTPCPEEVCDSRDEVSDVTTSGDARLVAWAIPGEPAPSATSERQLMVHLNITNTGASGLPICPHGKLWLLWEAGGFARGRFRDLGDAGSVAEWCLAPGSSAAFVVNVSSGEPEAFRSGPQHIVGLLEILRPLRGTSAPQRLRRPGSGNLVRAAVVSGGPEEDCEHFAAKIGRFRMPSF